MTQDNMTELAEMFKERDPKSSATMTTGFVISPPPEVRISLNDVVILDKDNLVFASSVVGGYTRNIRFKEPDWGVSSTVSDGGQGASAHKHTVNLVGQDTPIEWTDTLKEGDEVIMMPVSNNLYYVLDKAVRF